jgi:hypothetical protein
MSNYQRALRVWRRSFYKIFRWRYVLIPFATTHLTYNLTSTQSYKYVDVYIFGFRVARLG